MQLIEKLTNQCLAIQAITILSAGNRSDRARRIYGQAARHIIPVLFDDTPLGYLPKVIVSEELIDEEATVVNTRRAKPVDQYKCFYCTRAATSGRDNGELATCNRCGPSIVRTL